MFGSTSGNVKKLASKNAWGDIEAIYKKKIKHDDKLEIIKIVGETGNKASTSFLLDRFEERPAEIKDAAISALAPWAGRQKLRTTRLFYILR